VVLGAAGVEHVVEIALDPAEQAAFNASVDAVKRLCAAVQL
jgi:malate/lactate dehydrogenase